MVKIKMVEVYCCNCNSNFETTKPKPGYCIICQNCKSGKFIFVKGHPWYQNEKNK